MKNIRKLSHICFDNETQVQAYIKYLKLRYLPLKFGYLGPAAHTHDQLVKSIEYGLADSESALIDKEFESKILPKIQTFSTINIIDIGSGNGIKAERFIKLIQKYSSLPIRYLGLDFSAELSRIAKNNLLETLPDLLIMNSLIDFENEKLIKTKDAVFNGQACVYLFLGTTLGNSNDRQTVLKNIIESMHDKDILIIGVECYSNNNISDILTHYQNEPFKKAVFNCVTFSGIKIDDGNLEIKFNPITKDVEALFVVEKDLIIDMDPYENMFLNKGESIQIFVSHRYEIDEIINVFKNAGLNIIELIASDESSSVIVIGNKM